MSKVAHIHWRDTIYQTNFLFLIGNTAECAKIAKRKYKVIWEVEDIKETTYAMCWWYPTFGNVIWLKKFNKSKEWIGYLSHECLHALFNLFKNRGISYSKRSEEAYCYYYQDIVQFFLEQWEKKK